MTSSVCRRSRVALLLLAASPLACLGPNPRLEAGQDESETQGDGDGDTQGDGDGDTQGDGDGDTEGDGDGDTSTNGDGDGDTSGGTCSNGVLDEDETDVDCGGSCAPCDDGLACLEPSDCASMVCTDNLCAAPSCDDQVQNGEEADVDCGGDCTFCAYSPFLPELDGLANEPVERPHVEMFGDLGFALSYHGVDSGRLAMFDEFGELSSAELELGPGLSFGAFAPVFFAIDPEVEERLVHVALPGLDGMSVSDDLFLSSYDPISEVLSTRCNDPSFDVDHGDLNVSGTIANLAWREGDITRLRRYDLSVGDDGSWVDIEPLEADSNGGTLGLIATDMNAEGVLAIVWVRCIMENCQIVARRFQDGDWADPFPVILYESPGLLVVPRIALADDGSAFVAWSTPEALQARMLDSGFIANGNVWSIQDNLPVAQHYGLDALDDGSFAVAWADPDQGRVHLSRYVGPDTLKDPNLPDEGHWDNIDNPREPALATYGNRLVVVWTASVGMQDQIQGQVLAF